MHKTVAQLMSVDFVTVTARMSLKEALLLLLDSDATELCVVDNQDRFEGVVTDFDLLKSQLNGQLTSQCVGSLISRAVTVLSAESPHRTGHPSVPRWQLLAGLRLSRWPAARAPFSWQRPQAFNPAGVGCCFLSDSHHAASLEFRGNLDDQLARTNSARSAIHDDVRAGWPHRRTFTSHFSSPGMSGHPITRTRPINSSSCGDPCGNRDRRRLAVRFAQPDA